ncbi:MAG TPA: malonyl-CoA decarboxylase family protein [Casimicrobiaceae bacterium]|nr:malonyl-CoA decarboxylase family protein [Casimicrobiaceae bacterium]
MNDASAPSVQGAAEAPARSRIFTWLERRKAARSRLRSSTRLPASRIRRTFDECARGVGGEASARSRVATLAGIYRAQDDAGKRGYLELLAAVGDGDGAVAQSLVDDFQRASGAARQLSALRLRAALAGRTLAGLRQFNLLDEGVKFLVDLRADSIRLASGSIEVRVIDEALLSLFRDWFAPGNLELRRITWNSPASLLERLMAYEAVHAIRSWTDLRHRLESDRRCYAFFHPRMPDEPLVFVEVALMSRVAESIAPLLDESQPAIDPRAADAAIFYSISSTQRGLRGVPFGGFLIKRVVEKLLAEFPQLTTFATLSPVPRFRKWLAEQLAREEPALIARRSRSAFAKLARKADAEDALRRAVAGDMPDDDATRAALECVVVPLCARYLVVEKRNGLPIDPVARFHFGNGARLDRIDWLANTSARGLQESLGVMVNYVYEPSQIEENHEAYFREGRVAASSRVRRWLRRGANGAARDGNSNPEEIST